MVHLLASLALTWTPPLRRLPSVQCDRTALSLRVHVVLDIDGKGLGPFYLQVRPVASMA
jgi:hypothetical protein